MANEPPAAPATAWMRESLDMTERQSSFESTYFREKEGESKLLGERQNHRPPNTGKTNAEPREG